MKKLKILPYKIFSRSAKVLSRVLNGLRIRLNGKFRPKPHRHFVVNWGNIHLPSWWRFGLNHPLLVMQSSNKYTALLKMKSEGVSVPEFTINHEEAAKWVYDEKIVVGRRILNGSKGLGCVIYDKDDHAIPNFNCPLYTKHLRHKHEYRIHVFKGEIIDMVEKRKRNGFINRDHWIRSYNRGWVFCRDNLVVPDCVKQEAIKAIDALSLDFGAVDIAYREKENKAYVLEVNSAPGIEGTTINKYANALRRELNVCH